MPNIFDFEHCSISAPAGGFAFVSNCQVLPSPPPIFDCPDIELTPADPEPCPDCPDITAVATATWDVPPDDDPCQVRDPYARVQVRQLDSQSCPSACRYEFDFDFVFPQPIAPCPDLLTSAIAGGTLTHKPACEINDNNTYFDVDVMLTRVADPCAPRNGSSADSACMYVLDFNFDLGIPQLANCPVLRLGSQSSGTACGTDECIPTVCDRLQDDNMTMPGGNANGRVTILPRKCKGMGCGPYFYADVALTRIGDPCDPTKLVDNSACPRSTSAPGPCEYAFDFNFDLGIPEPPVTCPQFKTIATATVEMADDCHASLPTCEVDIATHVCHPCCICRGSQSGSSDLSSTSAWAPGDDCEVTLDFDFRFTFPEDPCAIWWWTGYEWRRAVGNRNAPVPTITGTTVRELTVTCVCGDSEGYLEQVYAAMPPATLVAAARPQAISGQSGHWCLPAEPDLAVGQLWAIQAAALQSGSSSSSYAPAARAPVFVLPL